MIVVVAGPLDSVWIPAAAGGGPDAGWGVERREELGQDK